MEMGCQSNQGTKNSRETENPDLISQLPGDVLIQIISMLQMKDAFRTGILSKRWENLWTQVHNIQYKLVDKDMFRKDYFKKMIYFIDNTLLKCTCQRIKEFTLTGLYLDINNHPLLDDWLKHILKNNVEFLKLEPLGFSYRIPDCLYQSSSLIGLDLWEAELHVLEEVNWVSIRRLCLADVWCDDKSIDNILMGSPALEKLAFDDVEGINHLNIMSKSVKKLVLCNMGNGKDNDYLSVNAPWLEELEISGSFIATQFELICVSSLLSVALVFTTVPSIDVGGTVSASDENWIRKVKALFKSLCNVDKLFLGSNTTGSQLIQSFTYLRMVVEPSWVFKWKSARVNSSLWMYDLHGIACFLESSPYLEELIIAASESKDDEFPHPFTKEHFPNNDPQLSLPKGNKFMNLKNFYIDYTRNSCRADDYVDDSEDYLEYELVKYILKSVVVLQKLVICTSNPYCDNCKMNRKFEYVPLLSLKLLAILPVEHESAGWKLRKYESTHEFTFKNFTSLFVKDRRISLSVGA